MAPDLLLRPAVAPVPVGLAGAGPWARAVHAPTLAAGPETRLAGVWSRTTARADALARAHDAPSLASFDALLEVCDAVALAVPPAVQPELAVRAARAGKTLLLEKPLAPDVDGARRVVDAIDEAGVGSVVLLTYRFADVVRDFLAAADTFDATGGRACFLSSAFLSGDFAAGWRLEQGALLDVGPHILDLVDVALGPVVAVQAGGDPLGWVGLLLEHERGARSEVTISCTAGTGPSRTEVELFGPGGTLFVDARSGARARSFATLRRELAETVQSGGGHPCDARRGLHLQRLVDAAHRALGGTRVEVST